jgi:hypothetical protein
MTNTGHADQALIEPILEPAGLHPTASEVPAGRKDCQALRDDDGS